VQQHFPGREPAVQDGDCCELNMNHCQLHETLLLASY
jgi:hypothetical protein